LARCSGCFVVLRSRGWWSRGRGGCSGGCRVLRRWSPAYRIATHPSLPRPLRKVGWGGADAGVKGRSFATTLVRSGRPAAFRPLQGAASGGIQHRGERALTRPSRLAARPPHRHPVATGRWGGADGGYGVRRQAPKSRERLSR
jgi:hypothetical protein